MKILRKRSVVGAIASLALVAAMAPGVVSAAAPMHTATITCLDAEGHVLSQSGIGDFDAKAVADFQVYWMNNFRTQLDCARITIERGVVHV